MMTNNTTTPDKLAEAQNLIENWQEKFYDFYLDENNRYICRECTGESVYSCLKDHIQKLLKATSLISYEKGREDAKRLVLSISKQLGNVNSLLLLKALKDMEAPVMQSNNIKILNKFSDAK